MTIPCTSIGIFFEIVEMNGKPTGGVVKDTVVVPQFGRVAVDLMADQPGLALFHCRNQDCTWISDSRRCSAIRDVAESNG